MPGPKMGPRPPDFDEAVIRQSPTMLRWATLQTGTKLRYACREFIKGHGDDEERLMRRIMIARRNNLRDHATLKKARSVTKGETEEAPSKKRKAPPGLSDNEVTKEMDVVAVEATRSYRKWQTLSDGQEFIYNQKYVKGKEGHDWLLRKNIWRRMRYRRENKKMVETLKDGQPEDEVTAAGIVDHALLAANAAATSAAELDTTEGESYKSVVEAAVAAAEQYAKTESIAMTVPTVHNPLEAAATDEALDAAAKLAAAATVENDETVAKLAAAAAGGDDVEVEDVEEEVEVTQV